MVENYPADEMLFGYIIIFERFLDIEWILKAY